MTHKFKLNDYPIEYYSLQGCIASIRSAWSWGYYEKAELDGEIVSVDFLCRIGCI